MPGFAPQSIAGPTQLPVGNYELEAFPAVQDPPSKSQDRADDTLASAPFTVGDDPSSVVLSTDPVTGANNIASFANPLDAIPAGQSRINVRIPADSTVMVSVGEADPVTISGPSSESVQIPAGTQRILIESSNGAVVFEGNVDAPEGHLTAVTLSSNPAGGSTLIVQRFSGLNTAPSEVPTGDSGLLDPGNPLGAGMILAGAVAAWFCVVVGKRRLELTQRR